MRSPREFKMEISQIFNETHVFFTHFGQNLPDFAHFWPYSQELKKFVVRKFDFFSKKNGETNILGEKSTFHPFDPPYDLPLPTSQKIFEMPLFREIYTWKLNFWLFAMFKLAHFRQNMIKIM